MPQNNYRHESKKGIYIIILFAASVIGGIFLIDYKWPYGFIIWMAIVVFTLVTMVKLHARNTSYLCPECNQTFKISTIRDIISPHTPSKKYLRCPHCRKRSWCPAASPHMPG